VSDNRRVSRIGHHEDEIFRYFARFTAATKPG
jgi:hypothetical protein